MELGGWYKERLKYEGFGRDILKICIIQILRNRWQYPYVALMRFGGVTTSEEDKMWKVIGWWIGYGCCVIWPLRVVLLLKTEICCNCSTVQG